MTANWHIYHVKYRTWTTPVCRTEEFVCAQSLREAAVFLLSEIGATQDGEVVVDKIMEPSAFQTIQVIDSGLFWCDAFEFRNGKLYHCDGYDDDVDDLEGDPRYDARRFK